jgi:nanoRNase/pAp phosphatase (c-di-AMP/oligoRNAs hydrolase)
MSPPILFISDRAERVRALRRSAIGGRAFHVWLTRGGRRPPWSAGELRGDPTDSRTFARYAGKEPTVIIDVEEERLAIAIARAARASLPGAPVLIVDRQRGRRRGSVREGIVWIDEGELLGEAIETMLRRTAARRRVASFRRALRGAGKVCFLVQNDPDPDAIASALALRTVLGLRARQSPIITRGSVTRPENRRMLDELRVSVHHVAHEDLARRSPLVLVDVQPPYFGNALGEVAAVVDHHPVVGPYRARHRDVRTSMGASATMALEYLLASAAAELTRPLATALLYGIITDTKSLSRSASDEDLGAFAFLFPRADHAALRRIQHPSYGPLALKRFGRALQRTHVKRGLAYVHLGRLPRSQEHIVAQLAEFALGMAGAEVAVVSGVFGPNLVMSARALSPSARLGDRLRELFDEFGSAGGHPVMAKAVVKLREWRKRFRVPDDAALAALVHRQLLGTLGRPTRARRVPSRRAASRASR